MAVCGWKSWKWLEFAENAQEIDGYGRKLQKIAGHG